MTLSTDEPQPHHHWLHVVVGVVVGLAASALFLMGSTVAYLSWLDGRPMHGVRYLGVPLALADQSTVRSIIERQNQRLASESLSVIIDGMTLAVPLAEFQPTFNADAVVAASTSIGTIGTVIERGRLVARTLWNGMELPPVVELASIAPTIAAASADHTAAVDASFALRDEQVVVVPHRVGRTLVADQLMADIEVALATNQPFVAQFSNQQPAITTEALTALLPQAVAMVDAPLELREGRRGVRYESAELLAWVRPTVGIDGGVELTLDQAAVTDSLPKLERLVNRSATPTQLSAKDGSVLAEGRTGTAVSREVTVAAVVAELERRAAGTNPTPVTATLTTVQPGTQTVEQDTTSGLYPGKYVEVDLSSQRLFQYEGETLIAQYRVSTGKWSTPTPLGSFAINSKVPRAYSRPYNLYMPYWMAFLGSSYGLHELPEWADGTKEGQNHLGTPVSHGCIRLGVSDAQALYDWAEIGTPVVVHK